MVTSHLEHDIFLLMLNLAQLKEAGQICALFLEALNSFWTGITLHMFVEGDAPPAESIEIKTIHHSFGWIGLDGDLTTITAEEHASLRNAVSMLAIILENRLQARLLGEENLRLETVVQQRTADLRHTNQELRQEVEERLRAEEMLRLEEQRFRWVFEAVNDAIWDFDAEHGDLYWSPQYYTMLGYAPGEMTPSVEQWRALLHPDDAPRTEALFVECLANQRDDYRHEVRFRAKDGGWRWILIRGRVIKRNSNGEALRMVGTHTDITSRKAMEHALQASEERYRTLIESSSDSIYVLDREWRHVVVNKAATEFVRLSKDHLLGHTLPELFPGIETTPFFKTFQSVMETCQPALITHEYRFEDGRTGVYDVTVSPVPEGILCISRDITERKRIEAEIQQLNTELEHRVQQRTAELEAANRELQSFAYVVSHDLKAPLRAISRLGAWLAEDYAALIDEKGQDMIDLLIGRIKRMDSLIDGILEYSRIGRMETASSPLDLNQLVNEVIDTLAPPPTIQITRRASFPTILANRTRIIEVFQNLIGNAIKFMDKPHGEILLDCIDDGLYWKFSVTDNGPGIEPKYFDRIFKIFQTLHPRDEVESTGIGLALVKKIVDWYGGAIWVESTPGAGSSFYFTLPKAPV